MKNKQGENYDLLAKQKADGRDIGKLTKDLVVQEEWNKNIIISEGSQKEYIKTLLECDPAEGLPAIQGAPAPVPPVFLPVDSLATLSNDDTPPPVPPRDDEDEVPTPSTSNSNHATHAPAAPPPPPAHNASAVPVAPAAPAAPSLSSNSSAMFGARTEIATLQSRLEEAQKKLRKAEPVSKSTAEKSHLELALQARFNAMNAKQSSKTKHLIAMMKHGMRHPYPHQSKCNPAPD